MALGAIGGVTIAMAGAGADATGFGTGADAMEAIGLGTEKVLRFSTDAEGEISLRLAELTYCGSALAALVVVVCPVALVGGMGLVRVLA